MASDCGRLRTVAGGCEHRNNGSRTRLYPQAPRVKREPFATHSGKNIQHKSLLNLVRKGKVLPPEELLQHLMFFYHGDVLVIQYDVQVMEVIWQKHCLGCSSALGCRAALAIAGDRGIGGQYQEPINLLCMYRFLGSWPRCSVRVFLGGLWVELRN